MPMSPRLLRPRQAGGDPDALRYIAAVQAADGQSLEAGVRKAINDFVVGCKADGIWSSIKSSCILAGARTLSGALTPLTGAAPTNANFVSIDYNRKTGLAGDGSTKRIDTNRAGNADGQDDLHVALYVSTIQSGALQRTYVGDGSFVAASGQTAIVSNGAGLIMRSRSSTAQTASSRNAAGLIGISRSSSSQYLLRGNNAESTLSQTSSTPPVGNFNVFSIAGTAGTFTDARIAYYSIGSFLTLSTLQARVANLITAIGAAIVPQVSNADAQDWLNRVYDNGGTVSAATASAVNTFCNSITNAGIRDRFFRLNLFCGNSDASLAAVRTPLFRGPSLTGTQYGGTLDTNVNFVQGDYAETGASGGLKGADSASAKRLDTGVAISTLTSTDFHASGYVTLVNTASSFRSFIGASSTNGFLFGQSAAGASPTTRFTFLPLNGIIANSHPAGLQFAAQTGNKTGGIYFNGSLAASAYSTADNTDGAFSAGNGSLRNIVVMAENRDGAAAGFYRGTLGGYSFGLGMNATQVAAFYTAMQAFQTALGRQA